MIAMNDPSNSSGKRTCLILDVQSIDNVLDTELSPFAGPRLHPEAASHLMLEANAHPKAGGFDVVFRVPHGSGGSLDDLRTAVRRFANEANLQATREVKEILKDGWFSLWIGLLAVVVFLGIAEVLPLMGDQRFLKAMSESLIIFYWVILWRPAELLLYEHIPPRRRRRVASLLARADVRVGHPPP
jgi:hypothetical protein